MLQIHIVVADVNDNAPEFQDAPRLLRVGAADRVGSMVARFRAHDRDEGQNARVSYSLREWVFDSPIHSEQSPTNKSLREHIPFAITDNGMLVLTGQLSGRQEYWLEILARDSGRPQLETHHRVLVLVEPVASGLFYISYNLNRVDSVYV